MKEPEGASDPLLLMFQAQQPDENTGEAKTEGVEEEVLKIELDGAADERSEDDEDPPATTYEDKHTMDEAKSTEDEEIVTNSSGDGDCTGCDDKDLSEVQDKMEEKEDTGQEDPCVQLMNGIEPTVARTVDDVISELLSSPMEDKAPILSQSLSQIVRQYVTRGLTMILSWILFFLTTQPDIVDECHIEQNIGLPILKTMDDGIEPVDYNEHFSEVDSRLIIANESPNDSSVHDSDESRSESISSQILSATDSPLTHSSRSPKGTPNVSPIQFDSPIKFDSDEEIFDIREEIEEVPEFEADPPSPFLFPEFLLKSRFPDGQGAVSMRVMLCKLWLGEDFMSKVVWVRNLPWRLYCRNSGSGPNGSLGIFLKCLYDDVEPFRCSVNKMAMTLHHVKNMCFDLEKTASHDFNGDQNDWGWAHLKLLRDFAEGEWTKDGFFTVSCVFHALDPQITRLFNEKTRVPVGMKNQGATCYMNAAIQILFSTNILRKAILRLDYSKEGKGSMKALQRLFYNLHTSVVPVSTVELTDAFGWKDTEERNTQHDVQEFLKIMTDRIEKALKGTEGDNMIEDLLKTKTRTFLRCLDVEFESSRDEFCTDIQLPVPRVDVSGQSYSIMDSLREITRTEILDGENKYYAEGHGLQRAEKGQRFVSFPKVLHLQLLRFKMDWNTGEYDKLNTRVEFSPHLDLSEFVEGEEEKKKCEYALHGVVSHSGAVSGGHYVTYICKYPGEDDPRWFKLDDSHCKEVVISHDVIEANFGSNRQDGSFNAYMLTYIRKDALKEILCEVPLSLIPHELKEDVERRRKKEKWRSIEINRRTYSTSSRVIRFVLEPEYLSSRVWDFFDFIEWSKDPYRLELRADENALRILEGAEEFAGGRIVNMFVVKKVMEGNGNMPVMKVDRVMEMNTVNIQMRTVDEVLTMEDVCIFIQTKDSIRIEHEYPIAKKEREEGEDEVKVLVLMKYYDGDLHDTRYVGVFEVKEIIRMRSMTETLARIVDLPEGSDLRYWKEESPTRLLPVDENEWNRLRMGDVFVYEGRHLTQGKRSPLTLLDDARRITVSFKPASERPFFNSIEKGKKNESVEIEVSMDGTLAKVTEELSKRIGHPSDEIVVWSNGKAFGSGERDKPVCTLATRELIDDPRVHLVVSMEFSRLSCPLKEAETKKVMNVIGGDPLGGTTDYVPLLIEGDDNLLEQLRVQIREMPSLFALDPIQSPSSGLRFVWRSSHFNGYFMFREVNCNEELLEAMRNDQNMRRKATGSLTVFESEYEEYGEEEEDNLAYQFVIPLIIVDSNYNRDFPQRIPSLYMKVREGMDVFDLKGAIMMKLNGALNWETDELAVVIGPRASCLKSGLLDFKGWYTEVNEAYIGLSTMLESKVYLVLSRNGGFKQERKSQSLSIGD